MKNKKVLLSITLLLVLTILISGCSNKADKMTGKDIAQIFKIQNSNGEIIKNSQLEVKNAKVTGDNGTFKVIMNTKETYKITIKADRYKDITKKYNPSSQSKTSNIKMEKLKFDIKGKVVAGDNPINKANIEIDSLDKSAKTDGKGNFYFKNIPSDKYKLKISRSGYSNKSKTIDLNKSNTKKMTIDNNKREVLNINIDLETLPSILEGKLVNNLTGEPLTNRDIKIKELDKIIKTNKEGKFEVELKPTNYTLIMDYSKFKYKKISVDVPAGLTKNLGNVPLELPDGNIKGMLYNKADKTEKIGNALVKVNETGETTTTNSDGSFKFNSLNADTYTLSISHDNFGEINNIEVTVKSQETSKKEIALTADPANLKGNTLSNVKINILETNYKTTADSEGNFSINGIPEGNYTVEFSKKHYKTVKKDITLIKNKTKDIGNVSFPPKKDGVIEFKIINDEIDFENDFIKGINIYEKFNSDNSDKEFVNTIPSENKLLTNNNLDSKEYKMVINYEGYKPFEKIVKINPESNNNNPTQYEVKLKPELQKFKGVISYDEKPVNNVNVKIKETGETTTTNSDGQFSFDNIKPNSYELEISHEDYNTLTIPKTVKIGETANIDFDFKNNNYENLEGDITGKISNSDKIDLDKNPLDITLEYIKGQYSYSTETKTINNNNENTFNFKDLPLGIYKLSFEQAKITDNNSIEIDVNSKKIIDDNGNSVPIKLEEDLELIQSIIKGNVINSYTGNDIEDMKVYIDKLNKTTTTNSDGSFKFTNIPLGDYTISFKHIDYITENKEETINISKPNQTKTIENKNFKSIDGSIKGNTHPDTTVTVHGTSKEDTADSGGNFRIDGLSEGDYTLEFSHDNYKRDPLSNITVNKNETTDIGSISLNRLDGNIEGIIKNDYTNNPISGATVSLLDNSSNVVKTVTSSNDGSFKFRDILKGNYNLKISHSDYKDKPLISATVTYNSTTDKNPITLTSKDGVIKGNTQPNSTVSIDGKTHNTGSDGSFEIRDISEGSYVMTINHENFEEKTINVEIPKNDVNNLGEIILNTIDGKISGRIENARNNKAITTQVSGDHNQTINGNFTLSNLPVGTYNLEFGDGTVFAKKSKTVEVKSGQTTKLGTIQLEDLDEYPKDITINVKDSDGNSLSAEQIINETVSGNPTKSGSSATFNIDNYDTYNFKIKKDGYYTETVSVGVYSDTSVTKNVTLKPVSTDKHYDVGNQILYSFEISMADAMSSGQSSHTELPAKFRIDNNMSQENFYLNGTGNFKLSFPTFNYRVSNSSEGNVTFGIRIYKNNQIIKEDLITKSPNTDGSYSPDDIILNDWETDDELSISFVTTNYGGSYFYVGIEDTFTSDLTIKVDDLHENTSDGEISFHTL